jgi:hypothetical protein
MSPVRPGAPGATRTCPHCRETILESASVCPACRHHLRFDPQAKERDVPPGGFSPLRIEGTIEHPRSRGAWEYSMVLSIRNERGEELTRRVIGVGALQAAERRSFTVSVEITKTGGD